jgi:SGNH domain (fused to AT3 domains)/Acyltransferase family
LGVEEQFYALYPVFFVLVWKLAKDKTLIAFVSFIGSISILSLTLNIYLSHSNSSLAFYSMPTRFWELGTGALVFLIAVNNSNIGKRLEKFRFVIILVLVTNFFLSSVETILSQVIAVAATALLLIPSSNDFACKKFLENQVLTAIGVRSYSIYLIHWPILVLSNLYFGLGALKNVISIAFTVLFSTLMYKYIENPFRNGRLKVNPIKTIGLSLPMIFSATALLYFVSPIISQTNNNLIPNIFNVRQVPEWNRTKCSGTVNIRKLKNPISDCLGVSRLSNKNFVYLIGDSHADQLVPMLKTTFRHSIFEVRNINMEDRTDFPRGSFRLNKMPPTLKYLQSNAKFGDLLILTFHAGRLNPKEDVHLSLDQNVPLNLATNNLIINLDYLSKVMHKIGVKVILIKDTPLMASIQTSESCVLQSKIFKSNGCKVSRAQAVHTRYLQSYAFDFVTQNNSNVFTWDPFDFIYGQSKFFDVVDSNGDYLMWDWNHITSYFAAKLAPNFKEAIKAFISN